MIPDTHLLTGPTRLATTYNADLSLTAKSLISSSFIFLQVSPDLKAHERMAAPQPRPPASTNDDSELWFSMPSSRRRQEQSAYQATVATAVRHHTNRPASPNQPPVPLISTTLELDKPLPPSPESKTKRHKPLLNLLKKNPSGNFDPSHLQPAPLNVHRRSSSNGHLGPEPQVSRYESHSMPSSPLLYAPSHPSDMQRAHSAAAHYADVPQYQAYSPRPQVSDQQRAVSMETYFDPSPRPRRGSTFPESTTSSYSTTRESVSGAPRPHTWVSPTETFGDATDFHLFAEATAGLPGGFDPLSPTEAPRLQGSLFARGNRNDSIPLLARNNPTHPVPIAEVPQYDWVPRQAPRDYSAPPQVSSSALPRRDSYDINASASSHMPNLNVINMELERLGLSDNERPPDDELPDYAQSQAEMAALKRKEASARARELESRWNSARGGR